MATVNMLEAKTNLSKLVEAVESGAEAEIIIARNGKPAARLVPIETPRPRVKIGMFNGKFKIPEPDPELDAEIARMFGVED
ncbi:prevent-host-death protein [alpha proteobacterium AAP81b]|nr:prevent-host-death protein [alpha proteobacterium AAP81b]